MVFIDYLATAKLFWQIFVTLCFKQYCIQLLTTINQWRNSPEVFRLLWYILFAHQLTVAKYPCMSKTLDATI